MVGFFTSSSTAITSIRLGACGGLPDSVMSAPATNVRPARVRMMASTLASSRAAMTLSMMPLRTPWRSAFTGGLSMVMMATLPSRRRLTGLSKALPSIFSSYSRLRDGARGVVEGNSAMQNAILHVDRNARVWWCGCQRRDARDSSRASDLGADSVVTLEAGHESWDIVPPRGTRTPINGDRKFVTALARGLEVLRCFTPTEGQLGNGEIAERTGLPKPTVSRLTYTLTKLGYLAHVERLAKYQLAPAALALGYTALANIRIRQLARTHMQEVADYAGAVVALGTRDRLDLIYLELARSKHGAMLRLMQGSRIPIANTAMGRAIIVGMPDNERTWLLGYIKRQEVKTSEKW